jgi:hypothetical protein
MYVSFESKRPYHIAMYVAGANAFSGIRAGNCDDMNSVVRKENLRKWQSPSESAGAFDHVVIPLQRQLNGYATAKGLLQRFEPLEREINVSREQHIDQVMPQHAIRFEITPFDMGDAESGFVPVVISTPGGKLVLPAISVKQTCAGLKVLMEKVLGQHCMQGSDLFSNEDRPDGKAKAKLASKQPDHC